MTSYSRVQIYNYDPFRYLFSVLACPSISRIEPSGNVRRVRGSVLHLSCYVDTKESYRMIWVYNIDASGKQCHAGGQIMT